MVKRLFGTLFLINFLILITLPDALCAQNTITVNPILGKDAQNVINSAIYSVASNSTPLNPGYVLLTAGTYEISSPIILKSNVTLKGSGDSTIIFGPNSVCNSEGSPSYVFGSGISNSEICNLQFKSSSRGTGDGGHGEYRNCIQLQSSSNCKIHDILFTPYFYNDNVRVGNSSGIQVYNCLLRSGHDGIEFLSKSSGCRAYNNDIDIRVNTGIRVDNGIGMRLDHNTFYGSHGSGWCCTEMEDAVQVEIDQNIFHDYHGSTGSAVVQPVHASGSVSFHDNVLWNVGPISMGSGSGNIMNPSDHNVANWIVEGYGCSYIGNLTNSTVQQTPVASFDISISSGNAPLSVAFTDTSTGIPTSWLWDFGDGTTSTDKNPKYTFLTAGNYSVTLTAINDKGRNSTSSTINVLARPVLPAVIIGANTTGGSAPLAVQFTDLSINETLGRTWLFDDGNSSTEANPIHTYTTPKSYTVKLTAKNENGSTNTTKIITVTAPAPKINDFKADVTSGFEPLTINFTSNVSGNPTTWIWKFESSGTQSFKVGTATYTFKQNGVYDITLTVKNTDNRIDTMVKKAYVTVLKVNPPKANFVGNGTNGKAQLTVQFNDTSTNNPTSWSWDFGDKSTSKVQNPVHKYTKAGMYTVSLIVKNYGGSNSVKKPQYIVVK